MTAYENIVAALESRDLSVRYNGTKAEARCPAHDDRNASLSVTNGDEGRVLIHCHAGCSADDVLAAIDLTTRDLFTKDSSGSVRPEIAATYPYVSASGEPLYEVVRFNPKRFRQRRPDGNGGWIWNLDRTPRVLYRLPEVLGAVKAGKPIFVVEGEKDVHALEAAGHVATCNPGGAGKWRDAYSQTLRGAKVAVIADRDDPGRKHARRVAQSLEGVAAKVKIAEPASGKDASDHLAAGKKVADFVPIASPDAQRAADDEPASGGGRQLVLTSADRIRSERIRWFWRPRLPLRSLSVIAGEKGLGKSILTNARLAAEATRGQLPGELEGQPIDVLICTVEDDWRSVVKPRLIAHGADLDRVHRVTVEDDSGESLLTLPDDVGLLEAQIQNLRERGRVVGVLVVDPISAFLSQVTDTHRDASVRRALAPLATMAERLDLVVIVVAHLTKDEGTRLINRVSGSGAFVNAARSVLVLAPNPDDPEGEQGSERVIVHVRGNWGRPAPTLAARVESRDVDLDDGSHTSVGYIDITGETDINVDDLQRGRDENTGADVEEAILAALVDGPRPSREVKAQLAAELECARKTVERAGVRMAERAEIIIHSGGFPRTTTWTLASGDGKADHSRDSDASAVGTSTNTNRVPTGRRDVPTGDSPHSRDSRDRLQPSVPTGTRRTVADLTDHEILTTFPGSQPITNETAVAA